MIIILKEDEITSALITYLRSQYKLDVSLDDDIDVTLRRRSNKSEDVGSVKIAINE
jgi:hypothetical protein